MIKMRLDAPLMMASTGYVGLNTQQLTEEAGFDRCFNSIEADDIVEHVLPMLEKRKKVIDQKDLITSNMDLDVFMEQNHLDISHNLEPNLPQIQEISLDQRDKISSARANPMAIPPPNESNGMTFTMQMNRVNSNSDEIIDNKIHINSERIDLPRKSEEEKKGDNRSSPGGMSLKF